MGRSRGAAEAAGAADAATAAPEPGRAGIRGVEVRSIDYVPGSERHGAVWQQALFWFQGNFQFFTIAVGFVGVSLGLTALESAVAGALGIGFGTLFMAFHAAQGPHLGLPQMIQSRAQLGYSGVAVALLGSFVMYMLFNVVDVILLGSGLQGVFGLDPVAVGIGATVAATVLAIYGHDMLHRAFRLLFVANVPLYGALTLAVLAGWLPGASGAGPGADGGGPDIAALAATFTVAAAYNISYAPYVSDYSRYLPSSTPAGRIVGAVFIGAAGAAIWLIALGAWLAEHLGATDALVGLGAAGDALVPGFGRGLVLLALVTGVAVMGINAYGAMLSAVTALDSVRPIRPTRRLRVVTLVGLGALWCAGGLAFGGGSVDAVFNALLVMLYLLVPWTAINLVDYFLVRRGRYAILDLFDPRGIYGRWSWRGLTAFLLGLLAMAPFFVIPGLFTGPAAEALGGVDVSSIVGLAVSGGVYYGLSRSLDVAAEQPAIEASQRVIATRLT